MTTDHLNSGPPRILVVENDLRWRQDHSINLTRWGYRPFLAKGQGDALLQDAVQKAKTHRCHVALVDMRLLDHYDTSDSSGLHLVPQLKPTRSIIVTAYSSDDLVQSVLAKQQADGVINKRKGRQPLKKALETSLQKICAAKTGVQFEWQGNLSPQMIINSLFAQTPDNRTPIDEVHDLLALLFPHAKHLRLQAHERSVQNAVILNIYLDGSDEAQVVKIGKVEDIEDETPNSKVVCLWDMGAILS